MTSEQIRDSNSAQIDGAFASEQAGLKPVLIPLGLQKKEKKKTQSHFTLCVCVCVDPMTHCASLYDLDPAGP